MLKENINIDESYTDRVVRQLVDETEIDFHAGLVRLPAVAYSWPFQNFGPGGLENILTMKKSSKFAQHIITNYGVDGEELKEILAMYIGVIEGRIRNGLGELIEKRMKKERENPPDLQEQIGYDDDAPNEVERQSDYATQVVDRMVKESKIDDSHEDPSQWNIYAPHMGRWIGPMGFISPNNRHWTAFEDHVMDIYGLDWELVGTAWNNYLKEVTKIFRLLARKAQGDDTPPWDMQYDYLAESTEDKFLGTIVSQLVDETEIGFEYGMPHISAFPDPGFSIDTSFNLNKDLWENLFGDMFKSFWSHCREVYGLTDAEIQKVWWAYKTEVLKKIEFNRWVINESTEDDFLDKIVNQLVDETIIEDDEYEIPVAYPSWITDEGFGGDGVAVDILLDSDKNSVNFVEFRYYVNNMYGLDEDEIDYVWDQYRSGVWDKEQQNVYVYQKSLEDDELNESLSSRVKKEVDDLFDEDKKLKGEDKIKKYFEDKGLDKWEADQAMVQYLSKQQSLNESKEDLDSYIHKVVNKMVDNTHLIYEKPTNTIMAKLPFYIVDMGFKEGHIDTIGQSYLVHPTARIVAEIIKHLILIYGMDKWEADHAAIMYISKMTDKINDYKRQGLNEGVDLSYSDDKDFPFLNKLANHTMSVTEIGRNAVLFPFIDGYISDGNFHKYFHGTPYDQLPFEATLKLDEYLRDFGLTENEKEIWWDIYVIKVIDAINERDSRIIDSHGELYEHAEPEDPIYQQIANSIAQESEIIISPPPYNKMFLRSPAWKEAQHSENVIDQLTGRIKDVVPDRFVKHLKEIYNIKYPTFVNKVWRLYRYKIINKIKKAHQTSGDPLNESTEDMYEKIVNSVLRESDIFEQDGKLYLRSPAFEGGVNVEVVLDIISGRTKRAIPNSFVKHMKEIYDISGGTPIETVWGLYRDKMIERIKIKQAQLKQIPPKQRKFFDHILKTLVDATEVQTMKDWLPDDETYEQRVWVTPPFLNHGVDVPRYRDESVEWNEFSYFGYGYPRYMKDVYGLTDQEGLKLWAPYYKALQKKVEELIERDRIIYGDD